MTLSGENCGCVADNNCAGILRVFVNGTELANEINDDAEWLLSAPCGAATVLITYDGLAGDATGVHCEWTTTVFPAP